MLKAKSMRSVDVPLLNRSFSFIKYLKEDKSLLYPSSPQNTSFGFGDPLSQQLSFGSIVNVHPILSQNRINVFNHVVDGREDKKKLIF